jgi:two-component system cell cycle sensor histidine kinase/response regulator CckA
MANLRREVLVVDEHPDVAVALAMMLEGEGYVPTTAVSSQEALEIIDEMPDLSAVVAEVRMPAVDGLMLHRVIKLRRPDLRVVLVTRSPIDAGAVAARDAIILKMPVAPRDLVHALTR